MSVSARQETNAAIRIDSVLVLMLPRANIAKPVPREGMSIG